MRATVLGHGTDEIAAKRKFPVTISFLFLHFIGCSFVTTIFLRLHPFRNSHTTYKSPTGLQPSAVRALSTELGIYCKSGTTAVGSKASLVRGAVVAWDDHLRINGV